MNKTTMPSVPEAKVKIKIKGPLTHPSLKGLLGAIKPLTASNPPKFPKDDV